LAPLMAVPLAPLVAVPLAPLAEAPLPPLIAVPLVEVPLVPLVGAPLPPLMAVPLVEVPLVPLVGAPLPPLAPVPAPDEVWAPDIPLLAPVAELPELEPLLEGAELPHPLSALIAKRAIGTNEATISRSAMAISFADP
ncbi:MAG TPA: hypothetical protein VK841_08000, partial [Polyangiaceae bacterium]|nr:hypothetical protein [Polyangiaceae bacterium]